MIRGTLSEAVEQAHTPRGEYVVVIREGSQQAQPEEVPTSLTEQGITQLTQLREAGTRAKEAVATVVESLGLPKNVVYRMWVETGHRRG